MKIRWWQFYKLTQRGLDPRVDFWRNECLRLEEELKLLKSAYFEQVKQSTELQHLLTPKREREKPTPRDRKA